MTRPEENLLFWKLYAEEAGCYEQAYPFETDHARWVYCQSESPVLQYLPHENFSSQVTLLAGLPGAGKDHWLSRHRPDLPVVSLDGLRRELKIDPGDEQGRVVQLARERCREFLRAGRNFAFNATNTLRVTRQRWLRLFADYRAHLEIVYLEPPFERILKQNRDRDDSVPERLVHKLAASLEPPTWHEGHRLLWIDD